MSWIFLFLAGIFEVVWASTMKLSQGFSILKYDILTIVGMLVSFGFLTLAMKKLPLGIAYPIWTGIGAVGAILVGALIFKDKVPSLTWIFVLMLVVGLIGIKVTSGH
ncbi:multidrug efflux SMR transporter [Lactococcus garvieae]|jgi:quaternary ammonium compound-resistance protein SugE|uniref:GroEL supressor protein SugE n=2 Tax=Lactococcus garvieae TaxID=1363 RepID=F9VCJ2_LACGL|nr:multidrug efflux SMR transporter [Lactococcus garvieae]ETD05353.1 SugE protein [Lactococcus garvieae TRF1]EOT32346.1 quaternary ammonium compound-resistance protein SugE [Lactococcus garvieae ATCC 49156]EOT93882.1 quaternary ammonium compound-resistance protein SugE [Lactococcus garvieae ATCC 49156]QSR00767.1 multidrug efflux SMR transporter [Lactococcus garvieae]BAK58077.1 GroEL supressor protein SugE [Lactococcus garvieae ATCC 49156]